MSWTERVKHPSELFKKGDEVEAVVLNIDDENERLSLGIKQLATDIWEDIIPRHPVGKSVEGKVIAMTDFGAFVELEEGVEGLIHVSEFDDRRAARRSTSQVGTSYQMKVIKLSPAERKIGLCIRALSPTSPHRLGKLLGVAGRWLGDAGRSLPEQVMRRGSGLGARGSEGRRHNVTRVFAPVTMTGCAIPSPAARDPSPAV